jgi:hypothetical protein
MPAHDRRCGARKNPQQPHGRARVRTRGQKSGDIFFLRDLLCRCTSETGGPGTANSLVQNIEEAQIPLRIITTDFERMEERGASQGSIVQAVAASSPFPENTSWDRIETTFMWMAASPIRFQQSCAKAWIS